MSTNCTTANNVSVSAQIPIGSSGDWLLTKKLVGNWWLHAWLSTGHHITNLSCYVDSMTKYLSIGWLISWFRMISEPGILEISENWILVKEKQSQDQASHVWKLKRDLRPLKSVNWFCQTGNWFVNESLCCVFVTKAHFVGQHPTSRPALISDIVVTEQLWLSFCVCSLSFFETFTSAHGFHWVTLCGERAVIFYCSNPRVGGSSSVGVKSDHRHIWVGKGFLKSVKYAWGNQLHQTLSCHILYI